MSIFGFLKRKTVNNVPQRKTAEYKTFPLQKYTQRFFSDSGVEDDSFSMSRKDIIDSSLEDEKIYKYQFDRLRPSIADNGNGYDVFVDDQKIAVIGSDTADALDDFLDGHPDHELLLDVSGGPFKIYESDSGKLSTGRDQYTARLCVKYFE